MNKSGLDKQIKQILGMYLTYYVEPEILREQQERDATFAIKEIISQAVQESRQSLLEEIKKEVEEQNPKEQDFKDKENQIPYNAGYVTAIIDTMDILNSKGTE